MKLLQSDECNVNEWAAKKKNLQVEEKKFILHCDKMFYSVPCCQSHDEFTQKGIDTNTFKVYGTVI